MFYTIENLKKAFMNGVVSNFEGSPEQQDPTKVAAESIKNLIQSAIEDGVNQDSLDSIAVDFEEGRLASIALSKTKEYNLFSDLVGNDSKGMANMTSDEAKVIIEQNQAEKEEQQLETKNKELINKFKQLINKVNFNSQDKVSYEEIKIENGQVVLTGKSRFGTKDFKSYFTIPKVMSVNDEGKNLYDDNSDNLVKLEGDNMQKWVTRKLKEWDGEARPNPEGEVEGDLIYKKIHLKPQKPIIPVDKQLEEGGEDERTQILSNIVDATVEMGELISKKLRLGETITVGEWSETDGTKHDLLIKQKGGKSILEMDNSNFSIREGFSDYEMEIDSSNLSEKGISDVVTKLLKKVADDRENKTDYIPRQEFTLNLNKINEK